MNYTEEEKQKAIQEVKLQLLNRGIKIDVAACGCCDGPWVRVEIDGSVILDAKEANIGMTWKTQEEEEAEWRLANGLTGYQPE